MTDREGGWPHDCHSGIEAAIAEFKRRLPGWWYSLGECQVSCDASCAPTSESQDLALIESDKRFDSGFHADLRQPSTLAEALRTVMHEALVARLEPGRTRIEATLACINDASWSPDVPALGTEGLAARLVEDIADQHGVVIADWRVVSEEFPLDDATSEEREARIVISVSVADGEGLFANDALVEEYLLRQAEVEQQA